MNAVRKDRCLCHFFRAATWFTAVAALSLFCFLALMSLPLLSATPWTSLFSWEWAPLRGKLGLLAIVGGSLAVACLAVAVALPLALGLVCGALFASPRVARVLHSLLQVMSAIPTVVYAFSGIILLVPLLRFGGATGTGYSWLAASIVLSLVVLPTLVLLLLPPLKESWLSLQPTTACLGMTPHQTMVWILLPRHVSVLISATLLAWARALGDTMIALMLSGNSPQTAHLTSPIRTLTAHMALMCGADTQRADFDAVFVSGLFLFLLCGAVHLAAQRLTRPMAARSQAG